MDKKTAAKLRQEYPNRVPLKVAAPLLGVPERQLSMLVAEGREPFADCFSVRALFVFMEVDYEIKRKSVKASAASVAV